jgi:tRNA threonylcarbamoyl adenosine modification protein (Sua5/YciO/YrdC/YwlC family)
MATRYRIHPHNPQLRQIESIVDQLHRGAVMLYPTDTVYAIGCDINSKEGQARIRKIRELPDDKPLTFVASSLSNISEYSHISDEAYQLLRRLIPGPYTFILPASKMVPKLCLNPKRKTTGIRVPDNLICQIIIKELGNPIISMAAKHPTLPEPETIDELFEQFAGVVDIIVDDESEFILPAEHHYSTMIDFTLETPTITRDGIGLELVKKYL